MKPALPRYGPWQKGAWPFIAMFVATTLIMPGCASQTAQPVAPEQPEKTKVPYRLPAGVKVGEPVAAPAETRLERSAVDVPETPAKPRAGSLALKVRSAQPADASSLSYLTEGEAITNVMAWPILIGATAGLAAVPVALAHATYLGVGIEATVVTHEGIEAGRRSTMERALVETDVARLTRESIARRIGARLTEPGEPAEQQADVIVLGYGFTQHGASDACSFATVVLRKHTEHGPATEERIAIDGSAQTADAPPPFCTRIKRLLEDDARLARRALAESAEIIGAIAARRLERTP
ncbi:MAG: hypothetical protein OEP48_14480 [Betaproteobacteria bacterium]|nr:hypothetical protein [Betaproteobacteria bacterium]MDH3437786.1 hypothetical protein [Betaproteobacteria bacterium]